MDLVNKLLAKNEQMHQVLKDLSDKGLELAKKQQAYKKELRKKALELRDNKMPVSMMNLVVYGEDNIADLRFERDCAEVLYTTAKERLMVLKLEIKVLNDQIEREFNK